MFLRNGSLYLDKVNLSAFQEVLNSSSSCISKFLIISLNTSKFLANTLLQELPFAAILQTRCSKKFCKISRKTPVLAKQQPVRASALLQLFYWNYSSEKKYYTVQLRKTIQIVQECSLSAEKYDAKRFAETDRIS